MSDDEYIEDWKTQVTLKSRNLYSVFVKKLKELAGPDFVAWEGPAGVYLEALFYTFAYAIISNEEGDPEVDLALSELLAEVKTIKEAEAG